MKKYVINGKFFSQRITGVQRFEREIVRELDSFCKKNQIIIAVPPNANVDISFSNIKVVKIGHLKGVAWEQISFLLYLLKVKGIPVNLGNVAPILKPGIVCVHDMMAITNPEWFSKTYVMWLKIVYFFIFRKAERIFTVSEYSKKQLLQCYPKYNNGIVLISEGWEHVLRRMNRENPIEEEKVLSKYGLEKGRFIFSNYQKAAYKNSGWIIEEAKRKKNEIFAVTGWYNSKIHNEKHEEESSNVKVLGYISDNELGILMRNCKAFVFPSFKEGFGLPPLEALASDAKVVVSDIEVFREIFEDSVYYLNPYSYDFDFDSLCNEKKDNVKTLQKYTWRRGAKELYEELKKMKR